MTDFSTGRIPTGAVIRAALALVREADPRARAAIGGVFALWPASVALGLRFAPDAKLAAGDPLAIAATVAAAVLPALAGAVVTRALLRAESPWRLDGGLAVFVGVQAGLALGAERLFAMAPASQAGAAAAVAPSAMTTVTVLVGAIGLGLAALFWQLWPVGRLMGDRTMTPRRSVEQMIGAVGASMLASLLLVGLAVLVFGSLAASIAQAVSAGDIGAAVILAAGLVPAQVLGLAVSAGLWRLRNGPGPAAVF